MLALLVMEFAQHQQIPRLLAALVTAVVNVVHLQISA